nr:MAG TPA: Putative Holliday junction resolvase [Caudoviricetes sp.]
MKILAIDPSSNKEQSSTTGIVLLDNARLVNFWVVEYGTKGFKEWFEKIGNTIECDVVVIEKFEARDNDRSKDNTVLQTIDSIQLHYPDAILQRNAGYQSDIPNNLLKQLGLWKFDKSHHQDVRAAARLALFWSLRNDIQDVIDDIGKVVNEYNTDVKKMATRSRKKK